MLCEQDLLPRCTVEAALLLRTGNRVAALIHGAAAIADSMHASPPD
jgi:hypothetical protein